MTPIDKVIIDKSPSIKPIWIMRQAGRYLPEFREIRKKNTDFTKLCLNSNLIPEITLQPIKRYNLDAAIIFSDILMTPYALGQKITFKKDEGPKLSELNRFVKLVFCFVILSSEKSINNVLRLDINSSSCINNQSYPIQNVYSLIILFHNISKLYRQWRVFSFALIQFFHD